MVLTSPTVVRGRLVERVEELGRRGEELPDTWPVRGLRGYLPRVTPGLHPVTTIPQEAPVSPGLSLALLFLTQTEDTRVKFLFDLYDTDLSGYLSLAELREGLAAAMAGSKLRVSPATLEEMARALVEEIVEDEENR